jgi:hypothetical protein
MLLSSHGRVSLTWEEMDAGLGASKIHASLFCVAKWMPIYMPGWRCFCFALTCIWAYKMHMHTHMDSGLGSALTSCFLNGANST